MLGHMPAAPALPSACLQPGQLELTHKGRAVYDSALPLDPAMQLYDSCAKAEEGACVWRQGWLGRRAVRRRRLLGACAPCCAQAPASF